MFNPNTPMQPGQFDFEARQAAIEQRKKLLAALMRQKEQAQGEAGPEGRMVGGIYVAPHPLEHLAQTMKPLMAQWGAQQEQKGLQADAEAYARADREAAQAHQERMPQARPELPGPRDERGSPELDAQTPTTQDRLRWAQEGMAIPSRRETLSKVIDDLTINEPVREEQRQFRSSEAAANRQAQAEMNRERLEQRRQEAEQRAEDAAASREDRAAARREANDLRRELAGMANDTRRAAIEAAANRVSAPKPVPQSLMKDLGELQDRSTTMSELARTFSPDYSGVTMNARTRVGSITGTDKDAVEWWKNYRKQSELTERHALFGAALTPTEQESWRNADIGPTTNPSVIQRNLATRAKLAAKVYATHRERAIRSGYTGVTDAFDEPARQGAGGAGGSWDDAPVRVNSKAERDRLPPGTRYIDPQGNVATR